MSPPGAGRSLIWAELNVVLMLASSVCSSGACPDTSIVSEVLPTTSLMLAVEICPSNTSTVSLKERNPDWLMVTVYDPGFNSGKLYKPVELVLVVAVSPVLLLFRLTFAFGTTAPLGSVTVPEIPPVTMFCARSTPDRKATIASSTRKLPILLDRIDFPPSPENSLAKAFHPQTLTR